jgi:hypothetical protein
MQCNKSFQLKLEIPEKIKHVIFFHSESTKISLKNLKIFGEFQTQIEPEILDPLAIDPSILSFFFNF